MAKPLRPDRLLDKIAKMLPLEVFHFSADNARVIPLGNAGGMSGARIYRVRCKRQGEQHDLCLRQWPEVHPSPERLQWIHGRMQRARTSGCEFVPRLYRSVEGITFYRNPGGLCLWELTQWMPGTADFHRSPTAERLLSAMIALARFHRSLATLEKHGASPGILQRQEMVDRLVSHGFNELSSLCALIDTKHGTKIDELCRSLAARLQDPPYWLELSHLLNQAARVNVPLQPCLRDIWHDHLLFSGDQLTGLIDYGAMRVDTPATDLARVLGSLVPDQPQRWHLALNAYQSVRPLSSDEKALLAVFDRVNVPLAATNWLRWLFAEGRTFDDWKSVLRRLQTIQARLRSVDAGGTNRL